MKLKNLLTGLILTISNTLVWCQDVHLEWVHAIGGPASDDFGYSITTDNIGDVYVAGIFEDIADFDPGPGVVNLTATPLKPETFIAKYSSDGELKWVKQTNSTGNTTNVRPSKVVVDNIGNVFIVGTFMDTVDFDPGAGTYDLYTDAAGIRQNFIWKLDNSGNLIWAKKLGAGRNSAINLTTTIALDVNNNAYIAGIFNTSGDFDPGVATTNMTPKAANGNDVFLVKLDSNGDFVWATQQPGVAYTTGGQVRIAIDPRNNDNIYIANAFRGTEDFDPGTLVYSLSANETGGNYTSGYISKFNSSGKFQWAKNFECTEVTPTGATQYLIKGLSLDPLGNIFLTGNYTNYRTDFDMGLDTFYFAPPNPSDAYRHAFIVKLDTACNLIWAKDVRQTAFDITGVQPWEIDTDASGNIYVVGQFARKVDFNPGVDIADTFYMETPTSFGNTFILKLDGSNGNFNWAKQFTSSFFVDPYSINIDANANIYTTGRFQTIADFDPATGSLDLIANNGSYDIFIHKMNCIDTTGNQVVADSAICKYFYGDSVYTQSGTYHQYSLQESGCRSIITLELTIKPLEVTISIDHNVLGTNGSYTSYQWYFNGNLIPGATDSVYIVTENGDYHVVVTDENGCLGTSEIYNVNNLAVNELFTSKNILIYPNPNNGQLYIKSTLPLYKAQFRLINILGQQLLAISGLTGTDFIFDISAQSSGIYFAEIEEDGKVIRMTLAKK